MGNASHCGIYFVETSLNLRDIIFVLPESLWVNTPFVS